MADKTSGANLGRKDLADSDLPAADPFAELTRIMGFDPRKAEGGAKAAAQASSVEEFKIDLEQELMREFVDDEPQDESVPSQHATPAIEESLPEHVAVPDGAEANHVAPEPVDEEIVAASEEEPVAKYESAPVEQFAEDMAEDMMEAELAAQQPSADQADEEDIPVIKLSRPGSESEQPAAEAAAPILADADAIDETKLEAEFNALLGNQEQHEILDTSAEQLATVAQAATPEENVPAQPAVAMADAEEDLSVAFGFPEPVALDKLPEPEIEQIAEPEDAAMPLEAGEEVAEAEEVIAVAAGEDQPAAEVKAEEPAAAEEDDPFAMLAAMAQKYRVTEPNDSWRSSTPQFTRATPQITRIETRAPRAGPQPDARVEPQAPVVEMPPARVEMPRSVVQNHTAAPAPVPEIETIDVPDRAVALADDLHIPEVEVAEEPPVVAPADDLDAEFNNLLQQMSTPQAAAAQERPAPTFAAEAPRAETSAYQPQQAPSHEQPAPAEVAPQAYRAAATVPAHEQASQTATRSYDERGAPQSQHQKATSARTTQDDDDIRIDLTEDDLAEAFDEFDTAAMDDFDLDGDFEEDVSPVAYRQPSHQAPKRRGLLIAAIVGGVAILGVAGAVAMSMMGDAQGSAPELVKADQDPFKVRPENPGGAVAPNQDSKVYETVARTGDANGPAQDQLISSTEEPVDLPDQLPENADDDLAMVDDGAAKSEDRIQPSAIDARQSSDDDTLAVAPRKVRTMVVKPDGTLAPREEVEPRAQNDAVPAQEDAIDEVADAIGTDPKPTDSVNEQAAEPADVAQEQTASIDPQPVVEGGWTMQIASESSEEAAKATYQKMLGRYGNILEGKGVNIIKADVAGKGTFWRIRIPAQSRDAAAGMCNSFKSAGGKCFVTKS